MGALGENAQVRKNRVREADVLDMAKGYLHVLRARRLLTFKRISVGGAIRGGRLIGNREMRGMADILIFFPESRCLHVELKAPDGRLSPDQKEWANELKNFGQTYVVVQSFEDLQKAIAPFLFGREQELDRFVDSLKNKPLKNIANT